MDLGLKKDAQANDFLGKSIGRGFMGTSKTCPCGTKFTVPADAYAKSSQPYFRQGKEVADFWYAKLHFPKRGYEKRGKERCWQDVSEEIKTPRPMTKFEAATWFERELKSKVAVAVMFRKVKMTGDEFRLCRKCLKQNKTAQAKSWRHEAILTVRKKDGNIVEVVEHRVNVNKPLPEQFNGARFTERAAKTSKVKTEVVAYWFCTFPAIKGDRGFTLKTDKEITLEQAKAWFKEHSGRGNLTNCAIYADRLL